MTPSSRSAIPAADRDPRGSGAAAVPEAATAPLETVALDRCLACGGRAIADLPMAYEFRGRFPAASCRDCGMRFLRVQPSPSALQELYGSGYFESDFRCGRSDARYFDEAAFRSENTGLLREFELLVPPGALLEVGCAGGWLLKHAAERGWKAQGVELSGPAVAHARDLGLDVHHGDLVSAALPPGSFDLVYMGDVLEHVPDCRAVLLEVARVLRPGGHLYLRGPITTNSLARRLALAAYGVAGGTIVLREPPYHLWEFTPGSLRKLFESCGLEVRSLRQGKIPAGRPHGDKSRTQRVVMNAIDSVNEPLTRAFNVLGDRVVVVGRRR